MENKYQNGKVYRIMCNETGLCYIGSTTYTTLAQRLSCHKTDFRRWSEDNTRCKCSSVKVLEKNNYEIILIENFPCNNKDELNKRERYWIETTECVNVNIPNRSGKEYRIENKDRIDNYNHEYHIKNQEVILEKAKIYREQNQDKMKENNKKQIELPPILCECGKYYTYKHKSRHLKSKIHQESIELEKLK